MRYGNNRVDPTPNVKITHHLHVAGTAGLYQIFQDSIGYLLVEGPFVSVGPEVEFKGLQFDAEFVGDIGDSDRRKIWLTAPRAKAGKLRTLEADFVISLRGRIREGLKVL